MEHDPRCGNGREMAQESLVRSTVNTDDWAATMNDEHKRSNCLDLQF